METLAERQERLAREQRGLDALAAAEQQITELRLALEQRRAALEHTRRQVEHAQQRAQQQTQAVRDARADLVALAVEPVRIGAPIALVAELSGVSTEQLRKALDEPEIAEEPTEGEGEDENYEERS